MIFRASTIYKPSVCLAKLSVLPTWKASKSQIFRAQQVENRPKKTWSIRTWAVKYVAPTLSADKLFFGFGKLLILWSSICFDSNWGLKKHPWILTTGTCPHGALVQIMFLSWVICRFQPLIIQGVGHYTLPETNSKRTWKWAFAPFSGNDRITLPSIFRIFR